MSRLSCATTPATGWCWSSGRSSRRRTSRDPRLGHAAPHERCPERVAEACTPLKDRLAGILGRRTRFDDDARDRRPCPDDPVLADLSVYGRGADRGWSLSVMSRSASWPPSGSRTTAHLGLADSATLTPGGRRGGPRSARPRRGHSAHRARSIESTERCSRRPAAPATASGTRGAAVPHQHRVHPRNAASEFLAVTTHPPTIENPWSSSTREPASACGLAARSGTGGAAGRPCHRVGLPWSASTGGPQGGPGARMRSWL